MVNQSGTHELPILAEILPGKNGRGHSIITLIGPVFYSCVKNDAYGTFFRNVEEIYKEVTGAEFLMPEKIY
jgi:hypothetical protein